MAAPARRLAAGVLSMVVPGAGQLLVGARRRGLVLLGISATLLVGVLAAAEWAALPAVDRKLVAVVLALDVALLGLRLFAVVD
ncbi:MAG: hypothetical protein ACRDNB_11590, partial [Gaiellaceae bacterium]